MGRSRNRCFYLQSCNDKQLVFWTSVRGPYPASVKFSEGYYLDHLVEARKLITSQGECRILFQFLVNYLFSSNMQLGAIFWHLWLKNRPKKLKTIRNEHLHSGDSGNLFFKAVVPPNHYAVLRDNDGFHYLTRAHRGEDEDKENLSLRLEKFNFSLFSLGRPSNHSITALA